MYGRGQANLEVWAFFPIICFYLWNTSLITEFSKSVTGVCGFFLQVKFATSLLALLAGDKRTDDTGVREMNEIK